ncbi:hypothetical protein D3C80_1005720 [compost metagenome]
MGAQLAHPQHYKMLRLAGTTTDGGTELGAVTAVEPVVGEVDAGVGEVGKVAAGFREIRLAGQVAPDDAQLLAIAVAAQAPAQLIFLGAVLQQLRHLGAQFARRQAPLQLPGSGQRQQHGRIPLGLFGDEVAGGGDADEGLLPFVGPTGEFPDLFSEGGADRRQRPIGAGLEVGRQGGQRRQAHGLSFVGCGPRLGPQLAQRWRNSSNSGLSADCAAQSVVLLRKIVSRVLKPSSICSKTTRARFYPR